MTDDPGNPRVQHGEPPLIWLWDLYPLADSAWGNIEYPLAMFADWGGGPGTVMTVRRWVTGPNGPSFLAEFTPADDYVTEGYNGRHATYNGLYQDEDRRCYVPQTEDLARVKSIFPNLPDPANPSWPQVEAELIAAGRSPDELRRLTAPALVRLLAKSHDLAEAGALPVPVGLPVNGGNAGAEAPESKPETSADDEDDEQQAPALTKGERMTLAALATFDPSRLASAADVSEAMPAAERRSERTTRLAINKLVKLDLAERPEGEKQGARLTIRGRRLATKIAD